MNDPRRPRRLVAALSGGVDSSVAACLAKAAGIEVVGVTLRLRSCDDGDETRKACCGSEDAIHARAAADRIGISHQFLDYREDFQKLVLEFAWAEYERGRTPNPCVLCNRYLKFGRLFEFARELDADGIVSGHYARVGFDDDGAAWLRRGLDSAKDQSYFLFDIPQSRLPRCWFPLGHLTKADVRARARVIGLKNAEKPESQDACFGVKGESFPETLRRVLGKEAAPGNFVDRSGRILGAHDGFHAYTLGQRRGLGISLGRRAFVAELRSAESEVLIDTDPRGLMSAVCTVSGLSWLSPPQADLHCSVQVRSAHQAVKAYVRVDPGLRARVEFSHPVRALTPGQAAVFYDGDRVLGGGWIEAAE